MIDPETVALADRGPSDRAKAEAHTTKARKLAVEWQAQDAAREKAAREIAQETHRLNAAVQQSGAAERAVVNACPVEAKALEVAEIEERAAGQRAVETDQDSRGAVFYLESVKKAAALPEVIEAATKRVAFRALRRDEGHTLHVIAQAKVAKAKQALDAAVKALKKQVTSGAVAR